MESTKGTVLHPPVMASVEVPQDVKEERMMGVCGQSILDNV